MRDLVTIIEDGKQLQINFNEALTTLGRVDLSAMSIFSLVAKRNYAKPEVAAMIAGTVNDLLNASDGRLAYGYLAVQQGIMSGQWSKHMTWEELGTGEGEGPAYYDDGRPVMRPVDGAFIEFAIAELLSPEITALIGASVESSYTLDLNAKTVEAKRVNSELQFTDAHAKLILKASLAIRVLIPAMTQYMSVNGQKKNENMLFDAYNLAFRLFDPAVAAAGVEGAEAPEEIDALAKIFKLTESNVFATRYSDKVIWSYLKNVGLDVLIVTRRVNKKIIVDVIPKIDHERNLIKFLIGVIRNQVKFQFKQDFPVSFKPVDMMRADNEGMTEFDKIEASLIRIDEGQAVINRLSVSEQIAAVSDAIGVRVGEHELDHYMQNMQVNTLQTNIVFLFFAKHAGGYHNLYNCCRSEYVTLCVLMKKWLEAKEFKILPQYVVATPQLPLAERKGVARKDFTAKLMASGAWKRIHERMMRHTAQNLADSQYIMRTIATMHATTFFRLPGMGEETALEGIEPEVIDVRIEDLASEMLQFFELV
jgi:hypothetical protein